MGQSIWRSGAVILDEESMAKIIGAKGAVSSKGVQGALIAALPAIDQLLVALGVIEVPFFTEALAGAVSGAGALLALWGRLKANKIIDGLF